MFFRQTGRVRDGFFVSGSKEVPCYLLDCAAPVLFDAGFSCLGPLYERDIRSVLGDRSPAFLLLTHMHFDHCGAAAYLKKSFPGLQIGASRRAAEIAARPGAQNLIAQLNDAAAQEVRRWNPALAGSNRFEPFAVDLILEDGDRIEPDRGLSVQALYTPGHTWDFMSYYVPEKKILVASEAVGCSDDGDYVVTEFLVDYRAYVESLQRLAALEVEVLCQGHQLVYLGDDARDFFARSLKAARDFKEWVERLLDEEHGDTARVAARVKAEEYDPRPLPKQPEPAYLLNLQARVRHLAEKKAAGETR